MISAIRESRDRRRLSIIAPTYNRPERAIALMTSLSDQILANHLESSVELILVDDGSKPASVARVRDAVRDQRHPFVRLIELPENAGAAAARNAGVEAASGALLAFIDDDIVPSNDYVCQIIRAHERHPDALVINGNLLPLHRHVYADFWFYYYNAVFNRPGQSFYAIEMLASGHCSMKREVLDVEYPLFDVALTAREDLDLYLRLKTHGIASYKDDSVLAFNECRHTLKGFLKQRMWYGRGQEQLIAKHGKAAAQTRSMPPPNRKFLHLYIFLRLSQRGARWYAAARRVRGR
jgi:GT2 family glycosyltransferase